MNHPSEPDLYDVIISGAGPVGLFLACELALAKCSVLILEKDENLNSPLKLLPFGLRGLNSLSIESFHRRGLLQELQIHKHMQTPHLAPASGKIQKPHGGGHFAGIPFDQSKIDPSQWKYRLPSSTPTNLMSEMAELETVLSRRAESLGVTIKRGFSVTDFQQSQNGVSVQAGNQSFKTKWLVGCDGSRSVVRKLGGFEFAGTDPEFTGYSARVEIADPSMLKLGRNITPTGMYLLSQVDYVILQDFDGGAFHQSKTPITREHIQEVLRRISNTDVTINTLHIATTWTDRSRQATAYRKGRVLLAGDAAHIHSPLGGQGLNLGFGDAMNLGWKLAAVIQNKSPESLLDTYEKERHPIGSQVLDWSRAQVAIMKPDPTARALNAIFRDLMNTRDGATYIAGRVTGMFTHYDLGATHPLVGHSVPNFEFEDGKTISEFMHGGQGILLDFTENARLKNLTNHYGRLKYISNHTKEHFNLSALLVRPDGIIAWVSEGEIDEDLLKEALNLWFT